MGGPPQSLHGRSESNALPNRSPSYGDGSLLSFLVSDSLEQCISNFDFFVDIIMLYIGTGGEGRPRRGGMNICHRSEDTALDVSAGAHHPVPVTERTTSVYRTLVEGLA